MGNPLSRSAGVTAGATYVILCCVTVFLIWGFVLLTMLNAAQDDRGHTLFELYPVSSLLFATLPPMIIAAAIRTAVGVLQLRPWARVVSMGWAVACVAVCLGFIAFRPFETFVIPQKFVSETVLTRQMASISFVVMLLPVSVWWLFYFRTQKVKRQFAGGNVKGDA